MSDQSQTTLIVSDETCEALKPYLPPHNDDLLEDMAAADKSRERRRQKKPYVTLTYASSLDSTIAVKPQTRTSLSGPGSRAMTHYLRAQHDAILIGAGTAITDNPGLNCRLHNGNLADEKSHPQPRPVILDPHCRWPFNRESRLYREAKQGRGKGPWILSARGPVSKESMDAAAECGGEYLFHALDVNEERTSWKDILEILHKRGIKSVMIEGGGLVINELLVSEMRRGSDQDDGLVNALIVTIAPLYLGQGGVLVCPERPQVLQNEQISNETPGSDEKVKSESAIRDGGLSWEGLRLKNTKWHPLGTDVVMCAFIS